jgi:hypothetical protein
LGFEGNGDHVTVLWNSNICVALNDRPYVWYGFQGQTKMDNVTGSKNVFYYAGGGTPSLAIPPAWDTQKIITDPLLVLAVPRVSIGAGSPILNQSTLPLARDLYGVPRGASHNLGAVNGSNP